MIRAFKTGQYNKPFHREHGIATRR